jgi:uncharacterized membrane protein
VYLFYLFSMYLPISILITPASEESTARMVQAGGDVAFAVIGLATIVIAYMYSDSGRPWLDGHGCFQIRTFWINNLFIIIAVVLISISEGYDAVLIALSEDYDIATAPLSSLQSAQGIVLRITVIFIIYYAIWWLVRNVKGYKRVVRDQPIPNPASWFFGG